MLTDRHIKPESVFYIKHPRAEKKMEHLVQNRYGWTINSGQFDAAEGAICYYTNSEVWSTNSTAQIYAINILDRKCTTVSDRLLLKHHSFRNASKYLYSIGAEQINLR